MYINIIFSLIIRKVNIIIKTINSNHKTSSDVPSKTELSDAISKDMKKRGFTFVGSTIIYSYMQAIGMINDHTVDCFCHKECCE